MTPPPKDTQVTVRIANDLLQQAKQRCLEENVTLAFVIRIALQNFVDHGMEVRIRRQPPGHADSENIF